MSFFERAVTAPPPPPAPPPSTTPSWFGPPLGVVPAVSTQQAIIFRADQVILTIRHLDVYPTGVTFVLELLVRPEVEPLSGLPWEPDWRSFRRPGASDGPTDEFLRLGVEFADGTTWTNLDHREFSPDEPPERPFVLSRGGGGGGGRWAMDYWLWPLPPVGDLVVYAEWPAFGISEVSVVLDATALHRDAAQAVPVWE